MKFKHWLLSEVEVGDEFETVNDRGDRIRIQVRKIDGQTAWIAPDYYPPDHPGIKMPLASVKHFRNDLNRKVDIGGRLTGDRAVDAVLGGSATYLGKGDDGVVFQVDDEIVKVSTTVPYVPENPWHQSPLAAAQRLKQQWKTSEAMRKDGVPGILPSRFIFRGDKAFIVRPAVEIPETLTAEQLAEVRASLREMHRLGWSINDKIQVGVRDGRIYHYDIGKAGKGDDHNFELDNDQLSYLYNDNGHEDLFAPVGGKLDKEWKEMLRYLDASEKQWAIFMKYKRKKLPVIFQAMVEEHPDQREEITAQYEKLMDLAQEMDDV